MAKKTAVSPEDQSKGEVARWVAEIKLYEKEAGPWIERSKKIVKRYKDERGARDSKSRYNILWSNVQTLLPAIYSKNPQPNVERRFNDDDDLSRVASEVLERSVSYFVKEEDFYSAMEQTVLDRLLPGRGVTWVRYVPKFRTVQMTDNAQSERDDQPEEQELYSEEVIVDYINWQDFGHTYARTWEEVRAVWKKVYLTRDELVKRFGEEIGKSIPLDYSPEKTDDTKVNDTLKKACIYEIWDKPSERAIWLHKDVQRVLEEQSDPLKIKGFFPCPKPLFATLANDSVIPVPDYTEYQDQAAEMDDLTGRIKSITKALKVVGVYDASAEGVQRILAEGLENTLIPVEQYAVLAEKGGLKGVVDLLPMKEIIETLVALYESRDKVLQVIYEITGISDIVRGATNPNETLGAQELKGQYANLRLGRMQKAAERFTRDLVRIMAEIIAEHFSLETIKNISGIKLPMAQEKQAIMAAAQAGQKLTEKQQEALDGPTWEEVYQLLQNDTMRCFRIDVETDSTIKVDQDAERDARMNFLTAASGFIQQSATVMDPDLQPLLMKMLMFGVRAFKIGKDLESTFELTLKKIQQKADAPPQQQPSPEQIKAQAEIQKIQLQAQADQKNMQMSAQIEQQKHGMELQKMQQEGQLKNMQAGIDMQSNQATLAIKQIDVDLKKMDLLLKEKDLEIKKAEVKKPKPDK